MQKKKLLTFEEHQEIGRTLSQMDRDLVHISVQLANAYPINLGYLKKIDRITNELLKLRSKLDTVVYEEFPEKTHLERIAIYFGPEKPGEDQHE